MLRLSALRSTETIPRALSVPRPTQTRHLLVLPLLYCSNSGYCAGLYRDGEQIMVMVLPNCRVLPLERGSREAIYWMLPRELSYENEKKRDPSEEAAVPVKLTLPFAVISTVTVSETTKPGRKLLGPGPVSVPLL